MTLKFPAAKAAEVAIGSIGRGYDVSADLRLKFCKGDTLDSHLIVIDEDHCQEIALPGGISVPNVPTSIKCDKGERTRFRSDVLSFQQVLLLILFFTLISEPIYYPNSIFSCLYIYLFFNLSAYSCYCPCH